jgi:hypothetical protein
MRFAPCCEVDVKRASIQAMIVAVSLSAGSAGAQVADPWKPLERFVGSWQGTASGAPGEGTVVRTYAKVMGGRFIHETNTSTYPPQEKNKKGEVHEHSGMFSFDRQRKLLMLRQFHIEGFVNTSTRPGGRVKRTSSMATTDSSRPSNWRRPARSSRSTAEPNSREHDDEAWRFAACGAERRARPHALRALRRRVNP